MPFWLLYRISDLCFVLIYYVWGYRKNIVLNHLTQSFPEKSTTELKQIGKQFYLSFCDQWIETLKLMSISKASLNKRIKGNWQVFEALAKANKNVYALLGHRFNWEWANVACSYNSVQQFAGIYLPLSSKIADRLMLYIRKRSGSVLIPADNMLPYLKDLKNNVHIIGFMADQTPANLKTATWFQFFNKPAPFLNTPEKAARRAKTAVVYAGIKKLKRGYYSIELTKISNDASLEEEGFITRKYVQMLHNEILQQPYNWLWTHRRWKLTAKENDTIKSIA